MSTELPKSYEPASMEALVYETWIKEKAFHAEPSDPGEPYCIVIPPPNVTGALHLGHAINNTLQDILIRKHRMDGFNAMWVPGVDHAGIATQAVVEKQLKEKENKTRHDVGREALVARIWEWKQQYGDRIVEQLKRLGCSCDWDRLRFTLDEMCARAVRETFFKLFKDGLIYRGKRLVNWDTHLLTSISDDELYTETVKTNMWPIRYPIDGTDQFVTVATTRPETMLADTAVAYHSSNKNAAFLKGKMVRLPLTNRLVPLIEDDILVDPEFGTGYVKVTPAHDPNDYAVYTRHKGTPSEIAILNLMTPDGKVNDADPSWKQYAGLTFSAARKKVVEDLIAADLLNEADIKPHEANVSFSDRSKTAIQPYLSDQWFVRMAPLAEPALEVVRNGTIKFFPERHAQQYLSWLGEKRDWPISRQLWWGHRIPVWSLREVDGLDHFNRVVATMKELQSAHPERLKIGTSKTGESVESAEGKLEHLVFFACLLDDGKDIVDELEKVGFIQDPDVLDTWFSSALWPHSTLGWPDETAALKKWYPGAVLLTGRDIITLWVARMVMTGIYNMKNIPFGHVAINPTILDGKGERMSKSKGNGVDPIDIIDGYGADALRMTLSTMATETQDVRMPVKKDAQGRNTSEKFDFGRNFCNKLWNASKFVMMNLESKTNLTAENAEKNSKNASLNSSASSANSAVYSLSDLWIMSRFNQSVKEANEALKNYRFDQYAKACYDFFWRDFCDWYVEIAKVAMKDPKRAETTKQVLAATLDGALRLMHPMIPFVTERLWWRLNEICPTRGIPSRLECAPSARLIKAKWPAVGEIADAAEHIFPRIQDVISAIRNVRNEHKVEIKKVVAVHIVPPGAQPVQIAKENADLIEALATCKIKTIAESITPPQGAVRVSVNGCEIYVEDLVDPAAESNRKGKLREDLEKKIAMLRGRMSNESYMAKAPPKLVEETKQQLADAEAELKKLG